MKDAVVCCFPPVRRQQALLGGSENWHLALPVRSVTHGARALPPKSEHRLSLFKKKEGGREEKIGRKMEILGEPIPRKRKRYKRNWHPSVWEVESERKERRPRALSSSRTLSVPGLFLGICPP